MIRAVLDANTIVSGLLRFRAGASPPVEILRAWIAERFLLCISDELLDEVTRTLAKPWFLARIVPAEFEPVISALHMEAYRITIAIEVSEIASYPEDDLVLAAAASASVDYLVTGDKQLLALGTFRDVVIVSPRDFLAILESAR